MTRATKLGSPAAGQSGLTRLCPSSLSPAPLSAWEQGRSITVAIVFSNKQLQEAWAKFLSNLFPDNKYTPLIITVENNTIRVQLEKKDLLLDRKVQRTRKANLFWTRNKEKWQFTWYVEAALLQKVDQGPSVSPQFEILSADKVSSISLSSRATGVLITRRPRCFQKWRRCSPLT